MIFLKSFSSLFRTGPLHQRRVLSYHTAFLVSTAFFMFFEMALSRCGVSLWLVWRKGFPGFLIEGSPFFVLRIYTVLPRMKKISRFARNDGVGRSFTRLCVIMAGFARGGPTGFPFFVLRIYTVLPQTEKISRSVRSNDAEQRFTKPVRHRDERIVYMLFI